MVKTIMAGLLSMGLITVLAMPASHAMKSTADLTDFDGVALAAPINVTVTVGGDFSVKFSGSETDLDKLESYVEDGKLMVKMKKRSGRLKGNVSATISMPVMDKGAVSGSGHMTVDGLSGNFEGAVSGSGRLIATASELSDIGVAVSGSGKIDIDAEKVINAGLAVSGSGKISVAADDCDDVSVAISGSGSIDLEDLHCKSATTSISGSGKAKVFASSEISGQISGSGSMVVYGNPESRSMGKRAAKQVTYK